MNSGWRSISLALPVPPSRSGEDFFPVPGGCKKARAERAEQSALYVRRSSEQINVIGLDIQRNMPGGLGAASTRNGISCSRAIRPISRMG